MCVWGGGGSGKKKKDMSVRPETIKYLEESIAHIHIDISFTDVFVHVTSNARTAKAKTNKLNYNS